MATHRIEDGGRTFACYTKKVGRNVRMYCKVAPKQATKAKAEPAPSFDAESDVPWQEQVAFMGTEKPRAAWRLTFVCDGSRESKTKVRVPAGWNVGQVKKWYYRHGKNYDCSITSAKKLG